ncbi:MAG: UDP-sulfoquinovose synthase [Candidatus Bathyarchaeia archaeon]
MNVFIAGIDGYLGWPLALRLTARGHDLGGADGFFRRRWVEEIGGQSAVPIYTMKERVEAYKDRFGKELRFWEGDLRDYNFVVKALRDFRPDAVVHLGECPSAPYSMIDVHHATFVQSNNLTTTLNLLFAIRDICPDAHLLKIGTMGEYGTPNIDIPEGFFEIDFRSRRDKLPFPRQAGSWYHWSKVHDSNNIMFACKIWNMRSTDIMQGVVFGTRIDEMNDERFLTRFDFDQVFGTVVNRYCAQAVVGHPITPFGKGLQRRGFLPLRDSMQCLTLALENPPSKGEYRVLNQFEEVYSVTDLALKVKKVAHQLNLDVNVRNLENPRIELEDHYYRPDHQKLFDLGYHPTRDVEGEIKVVLQDLMKHRDRIEEKKDLFIPDVRWSGSRSRVGFLTN